MSSPRKKQPKRRRQPCACPLPGGYGRKPSKHGEGLTLAKLKAAAKILEEAEIESNGVMVWTRNKQP